MDWKSGAQINSNTKWDQFKPFQQMQEKFDVETCRDRIIEQHEGLNEKVNGGQAA